MRVKRRFFQVLKSARRTKKFAKAMEITVQSIKTWFHGVSSEQEAKNSIKLARRLMDCHSLDRAVLLMNGGGGNGSLNAFTTNDIARHNGTAERQ